jgi:DNA-binding response OmpR family regulator
VNGKAPALAGTLRRDSTDLLAVAPERPDVEVLLATLQAAGTRIERAHSPESVARAIVGGRPDVVLVDLREDDGLAERLLDWVTRNASAAALVLTNLDEADARIRALRLGAADHLIAPFELREAIARVEMLLADRRRDDRDVVEAGDLILDPVQRCAIRNGEVVPLTPREVDVLAALIERREKPVSKQELLAVVWRGERRSENVVEANVSSLRRKLHSLGPPVIHTVHRSGYLLRPVAPSATLTRATLVAERDRLVRERDEVIARRDEVIRRLRGEQRRQRLST